MGLDATMVTTQLSLLNIALLLFGYCDTTHACSTMPPSYLSRGCTLLHLGLQSIQSGLLGLNQVNLRGRGSLCCKTTSQLKA
jgi:hypothetical protein